jgi:hypothetical protein
MRGRNAALVGLVSIVIASSMVLSSCSSGGTSVQMAAADPLSALGTAQVSVTAKNPDWARIAGNVERAIAERLRERSTFALVTRSGEMSTRQPDAVIRITLTDVRDVSDGARNVLGAFAGRGHVTGDVELLKGPEGSVVAKATIGGKTSWGTQGAGTTEQAIGIFADEAARFIADNTRL